MQQYNLISTLKCSVATIIFLANLTSSHSQAVCGGEFKKHTVRKKENGFRLSKLDFKLLEDVTGVEDRSYEISLQQIHYKIYQVTLKLTN